MNVNEIRVGNVLKVDGDILTVISTQHVKPGKGGAFLQCVMQNINKPQKKHIKFRTNDKVEKIEIFEHSGYFIEKNGDQFLFLDMDTQDEIILDHVNNSEFLNEGETVQLIVIEDIVQSIKIPKNVNCKVKHTNPYIKGQSATSQMKDAELINGIKIKVPQYIVDGEDIIVNTEDLTFVSRVDY